MGSEKKRVGEGDRKRSERKTFLYEYISTEGDDDGDHGNDDKDENSNEYDKKRIMMTIITRRIMAILTIIEWKNHSSIGLV